MRPDGAEFRGAFAVAKDEAMVETASGVPVEPIAVETLAGLLAVVRPAAAALPMEAEPGDFLIALEALAEEAA